jgi:hypothetical protein
MNSKVLDYGEDTYCGFPCCDTVYQYIRWGGRGGVEEHFMEFLWNVSLLNSDDHSMTGHLTCSTYVLPFSRCPEGINLSRPVHGRNNTVLATIQVTALFFRTDLKLCMWTYGKNKYLGALEIWRWGIYFYQ